MEAETKKINGSLMTGWSIIALVLFISYIGEYLKGARTAGYVVVFLICTILPCAYCIYQYKKKPDSEQLKIYIVVGYFVMYLFSMITGSTNMVFSYILPLLSLLILYHQPKLILYTGIASMLVNIYFVAMQFVNGEINLKTSKEAEIQLALIALCFGGCYTATKIYDRITIQNKEFMIALEEKNRQNQQLTFQTIMTIVNTIDAKDQYTKGHSQRVFEYSAALAKELGLPQEQMEKIRYIALLHDIGKIGVPDNILNKPEKLTNEELSLMKMHTIVGGEILKDIESVQDLNVGAKYHHERYDGRGYPEGLKGDEIPYVARLICVADAYDAMAINHIYRKHLTEETILQEIEHCSATQFDPTMADAFLKIIKENRLQELSPELYSTTEKSNMANQVLQKLLKNTGSFAEKDLDLLTGIYNKSHGEHLLELYLTNGNGCLLLIDVDALQTVNGKHGLVRGDLYLKTVAHLLDSVCDDKILYRGDSNEFVCFLCGTVSKEELDEIISVFYKRLEAQKTNDEILKSLNVSIGAVFTEFPKCSKEELMTKVSKALVAAKKKQQNGFFEYHFLYADNSKILSKVGLDSLMSWLQDNVAYPAAFQINYPEFLQTIDEIKKVLHPKEQQMQLIMFTATITDEEAVTLEQKSEVMELLKKAIIPCLKNSDMTTRFSSSQQIVILIDTTKNNAETTANQIISNFYKMNQYKNFSIHYESGEFKKYIQRSETKTRFQPSFYVCQSK